MVNILEFDQTQEKIILSNKGTLTDPEVLINKTKDLINIELSAKIKNIIVKDDYENGILIEFDNIKGRGFIPRKKATFSRFISLSEKYNIDQKINVLPINFDINHATLICEIAGLREPWLDIDNFKRQNLRVKCVVRRIESKYVICEVSEGLEGRLPLSEISWQDESREGELINQFKIGEEFELLVIGVDERRRLLNLSKKRLVPNPLEEYFQLQQIVEAEVVSIVPAGANVLLGDKKYKGYLPKSEVTWLFCEDITKVLKVGEIFKVRLMQINYWYNNIIVSAKRAEVNNYDQYKENHSVGSLAQAKVFSYCGSLVRLKLFDGTGYCVEGYVHKSEITYLLFLEEEDMGRFLKRDNVYNFVIKKFIDSLQIVELSRKAYLKGNIKNLKAEGVYKVEIISVLKEKVYLHCDEFESSLKIAQKPLQQTGMIDVRIKIKNEEKGWVTVEWI